MLYFKNFVSRMVLRLLLGTQVGYEFTQKYRFFNLCMYIAGVVDIKIVFLYRIIRITLVPVIQIIIKFRPI